MRTKFIGLGTIVGNLTDQASTKGHLQLKQRERESASRAASRTAGTYAAELVASFWKTIVSQGPKRTTKGRSAPTLVGMEPAPCGLAKVGSPSFKVQRRIGQFRILAPHYIVGASTVLRSAPPPGRYRTVRIEPTICRRGGRGWTCRYCPRLPVNGAQK
jgi:hypothetical protein